jgi:hypothetical protein
MVWNRWLIALVVVAPAVASAHAQEHEGGDSAVAVTGSVNVNSKGISLVPALTLGRPAAIFDLGVRKGAASFEPQLRFALDGKPWSFLLWGRYRAIEGKKLRLTLGAHPAFSFRTTTATIGTASRELIEVRRYVAVEATPTYATSANTTVGGYYLYSHGVDRGAPPHTHLVAARAGLSNVTMGRFVLQVAPQFYYLYTNGQDGTYVSASAAFGRHGSPWSVTAVVNQPVATKVAGGGDFLWNVGIGYAFR